MHGVVRSPGCVAQILVISEPHGTSTRIVVADVQVSNQSRSNENGSSQMKLTYHLRGVVDGPVVEEFRSLSSLKS